MATIDHLQDGSLRLNCPAKINLGLYLTGKRADGYHLLETVFYPASLADTLTVSPAQDLQLAKLSISGLTIPDTGRNNLCLKAWQALRDRYGAAVPAVRIQLQKRIPMGAGLGGGSSNAAGVLRLVAAMMQNAPPASELHSLATALGADVPFFLNPMPQLATGIGEQLTPIAVDLSGFQLELVTPPIHSGTVEAYRALRPDDFLPEPNLTERIAAPVDTWRTRLHNGFERAVFGRFPALARLKADLYARGAVYASLSGSGSALYGIFRA